MPVEQRRSHEKDAVAIFEPANVFQHELEKPAIPVFPDQMTVPSSKYDPHDVVALVVHRRARTALVVPAAALHACIPDVTADAS